MEKLRSIEEAADILGISPWTVRAFVRRGKIRPVRIGRRMLIEQADIEALIENGRQTGAGNGKKGCVNSTDSQV